MFEFQTMLMEITSTESINALVLSVAGIIGTIGVILHSLSQRVELGSHRKALQSTADLLTDISTHVKTSKEDIQTLAKVTYDMLPEEAQKIVNAQNVRLAELEKKVEAANQQLAKLPPALDHI